MQKKIPAIGIWALLVLLVLSVMLLLYYKLHGGTRGVYTPLPLTPLVNLQGEKVELPTYFPGKDYLLLFFAETSPTSLSQLAELSKAADSFPPSLVAILIHPGKMRAGLPIGTSPRLNLLIDPEGNFSQQLNIRTVPTMLLIVKGDRKVALIEGLATAEEIMEYIPKLIKTED